MNFCTKCASYYQTPGTCNCFAQAQPAVTQPIPFGPYPWNPPMWTGPRLTRVSCASRPRPRGIGVGLVAGR